MKFGSTMYNLVLRRTSTFTIAVLASAFVFERAFDMASEKIFDTINKGVSVHLCFLLSLHLFLFDLTFLFDIWISISPIEVNEVRLCYGKYSWCNDISQKRKKYWMIKTLASYILICELTHDSENDMFWSLFWHPKEM